LPSANTKNCHFGRSEESAVELNKKADSSTCAPEVSIPLEGKVLLGDGLGMTANYGMTVNFEIASESNSLRGFQEI
jgi:hypothetical protein